MSQSIWHQHQIKASNKPIQMWQTRYKSDMAETYGTGTRFVALHRATSGQLFYGKVQQKNQISPTEPNISLGHTELQPFSRHSEILAWRQTVTDRPTPWPMRFKACLVGFSFPTHLSFPPCDAELRSNWFLGIKTTVPLDISSILIWTSAAFVLLCYTCVYLFTETSGKKRNGW